MRDLTGKTCTVEIGILRGTPCGRPATAELTHQGEHRGWRCALHESDVRDDKGGVHPSVWHDFNMIEGLQPHTERRS